MRDITVIYHREPEGWWAHSPDVPGWGAGGATYEEVRELADEGIPWFLEVPDQTVRLLHRFDAELSRTVGVSVEFEVTMAPAIKLELSHGLPSVASPAAAALKTTV